MPQSLKQTTLHGRAMHRELRHNSAEFGKRGLLPTQVVLGLADLGGAPGSSASQSLRRPLLTP